MIMILSILCILLESIDYFGTSEYFSKNFGDAINWSSVVNFHYLQMSLVVNTQLIFGDD